MKEQPDFIGFDASDEGPHRATANPHWQESVLLHWYDEAKGIGGWHRIGHEPNNQGGRAALWSYLFSREGWQYRRCGEVALTQDDCFTSGFGAGPKLRFAYEDDAAKWRIRDDGLSADIKCRNLFALVDPFPRDDEVAAKRFAHHFEVAGRVTGTVTHDGKTIAIDGYGYRDHSWSERDWENGMLNHRWFTGTLGPSFSFAAITAQSREGKLTRVGFVARNGKVQRTRDVDVIAYIEPDGLTHRGGQIRMTLDGGEKIFIRCRPVAGVLFTRGTVVMVEMMCEAEGHGLKGYCDAEISTNPRDGKGPVRLSLNANMSDGFSAYARMEAISQ
jgi:hypothetical protein